MRRGSFKGVIGILKCFAEHGQQFGIFPLPWREFVVTLVEMFEFPDKALIFSERMTAGNLRASRRP